MNHWKNIWQKRIVTGNQAALDYMLKADGFDTGPGVLTEDSWLEYVSYIKKLLSYKTGQSVFEIGCGSGAFLYPFYLEKIKVGGIDYSESLLDAAKKYMPEGSFNCQDASLLDSNNQYDIVISNSVFQYFESYGYAEAVIEKMLNKTTDKIAVLDVSDKLKEKEAYKIRKGYLSDGEYEIKYKGLDHLFYHKDWFNQIARKANCLINISAQNIKGYRNNPFKYNVIFQKK